MRPDRVLIACEAPGLFRVRATQASSSHSVIDLAALFRVPARASCNHDDDIPSVFAGDSGLAFGNCPACPGRHRPRTDAEGCRKAAPLATPGAVLRQGRLLVLVDSPDRVLAGPPQDRDAHHRGATTSEDPRPPGLEPPLGAGSDMSVPRERPKAVTQKPKAVAAAMPYKSCLD